MTQDEDDQPTVADGWFVAPTMVITREWKVMSSSSSLGAMQSDSVVIDHVVGLEACRCTPADTKTLPPGPDPIEPMEAPRNAFWVLFLQGQRTTRQVPTESVLPYPKSHRRRAQETSWQEQEQIL